MSAPNKNRFIYATLIDLGYDPANPEILLELGMENPVDWDAVDAEGGVICKRLDFVLTVDYVKIAGEPLGIHCVYDRVRKDHGVHGGLYVYVLVLRPTRDNDDRESDRVALETAVGESRVVRRRSWCSDIGEVRIRWRHVPGNVIRLANGAFIPEETGTEAPQATDDDVLRMCTAFDSFCDELAKVDPPSSPGIPLSDEDIEEVLDGALAEESDEVPYRPAWPETHYRFD